MASVQLIEQLATCYAAIREYVDVYGKLPNKHIRSVLDYGAAWREPTPIAEKESGENRRKFAMRVIHRGVLQTAASMLLTAGQNWDQLISRETFQFSSEPFGIGRPHGRCRWVFQMPAAIIPLSAALDNTCCLIMSESSNNCSQLLPTMKLQSTTNKCAMSNAASPALSPIAVSGPPEIQFW
jgi:hypothetical protein